MQAINTTAKREPAESDSKPGSINGATSTPEQERNSSRSSKRSSKSNKNVASLADTKTPTPIETAENHSAATFDSANTSN